MINTQIETDEYDLQLIQFTMINNEIANKYHNQTVRINRDLPVLRH